MFRFLPLVVSILFLLFVFLGTKHTQKQKRLSNFISRGIMTANKIHYSLPSNQFKGLIRNQEANVIPSSRKQRRRKNYEASFIIRFVFWFVSCIFFYNFKSIKTHCVISQNDFWHFTLFQERKMAENVPKIVYLFYITFANYQRSFKFQLNWIS